jgi:nitrate reductase gamma subunit
MTRSLRGWRSRPKAGWPKRGFAPKARVSRLRSGPPFSIRRLALAAVCAATVLGFAATPALAIHFQPESYSELLTQLHRREIVAIVLHPTGPKAHASAHDRQHFTVIYTQAEVTPLRAAATAGGSSFAIATAKPKSTTTHHKLRYIAGGVLIVVIVVVLVVLLIGRRRTLEDEEGSSASGEAASAPPPAGSG